MERSEVQSLPRRRSEQMPNFPSLVHSLNSKHSPRSIDLHCFCHRKRTKTINVVFLCYTACDVNIHCHNIYIYIIYIYIDRCTVVLGLKGFPFSREMSQAQIQLQPKPHRPSKPRFPFCQGSFGSFFSKTWSNGDWIFR